MGDLEPAVGKEGLRKRNLSFSAISPEEARQAVLELNALEEKKDVKDEKEKRTFGRTPDGTGKIPDYFMTFLPPLTPSTNWVI